MRGRKGGLVFLETRVILIQQASLNPPLLFIVRQDLRWKEQRGVILRRRQGAGGGLPDLGQRKAQCDRPRQRLPGCDEGLRVRKRLGLFHVPLLDLFGIASSPYAGPQRLASVPSLPPLPIIARQDSRRKKRWNFILRRRRGSVGGLPDLG